MKWLYRIYQLCVAVPVLSVATLLTCLITSIGCLLGNAGFWAYFAPRIWGWLMCRVMLLPVTVQGRERLDPNTSYVFIANHQGYYDIFLAYGFLRRNFKWMMKKSLGRIPFVGKACRDSGQIFVDKGGPKAIQHTYDQARQVLQGGTSVFVFPEGARTFTGHMGIFRRGAFQLADELQLAVVPITIDGCFDVLPRMRGFNFLTWHPLRLTIHEPIPPCGRGQENVKQTMDQSYAAVMSALPAHHQGYVKNEDQ